MAHADSAAAAAMTATLDSFLEAFNANDLDRVMTHFADDAVYRPGTGVERVGRAAIRAELAPQFALVYGAMRFDELDRVVDERSGKIAIRWICRHDLSRARPATLALKLERLVVRATLGDRFGWEGIDVFHFDAAGRISGKFSYAGFRRPRLDRTLGASAAPAQRAGAA